MKCFYCKCDLSDCVKGVDYIVYGGYPMCEGCQTDMNEGLGDDLRDDLEGIGIGDIGGEPCPVM